MGEVGLGVIPDLDVVRNPFVIPPGVGAYSKEEIVLEVRALRVPGIGRRPHKGAISVDANRVCGFVNAVDVQFAINAVLGAL